MEGIEVGSFDGFRGGTGGLACLVVAECDGGCDWRVSARRAKPSLTVLRSDAVVPFCCNFLRAGLLTPGVGDDGDANAARRSCVPATSKA